MYRILNGAACCLTGYCDSVASKMNRVKLSDKATGGSKSKYVRFPVPKAKPLVDGAWSLWVCYATGCSKQAKPKGRAPRTQHKPQGLTSLLRAPTDHISKRILQNIFSGIPLMLGFGTRILDPYV